MRLLILTWEFPPCIVGGLGRHVDRLTESLLDQGHEVHVLTRAHPEAAFDETRGRLHVHRVSDAVTHITLDDFVPYVMHVNRRMLAKGRDVCASHEIDMVHAHDWLVAEATDGLRRGNGLPVVSTIHATEYGRHQGWLPADMNRRIHQIECGLGHISRRVIVCSQYMRDQVRAIFDLPSSRVAVVENGVAVRMSASRASARREPVVLFAGRLEYEKGVQTIIEAAPAVLDRVPDARFVVAGEGTYGDALRKQVVEAGLAHCFEFLGFVEEKAMPALYRTASALVAPSIYEPFGIVALEGMAAQVPVVVGDTGGLREIVDHGRNGLCVPPENPKALARAVTRILTVTGLSERLAAGGADSVATRTWDKIAERTASVYDEVIAEHHSTAGRHMPARLALVWKESAAYRRAIGEADHADAGGVSAAADGDTGARP